MKYFYAIFLILSFNCLNAQSADTVYWSPCYKLSWEDFKGKVDTTVNYSAITASGITYSYHFTDSTFSFKIDAFFEKGKSWKKEHVNAYILNHEQVHFDISEIFARKLRAQFSMLSPKRETIKSDIKNIVSRIMQEKEEFENKYDIETDFSNDINKQAYWNNNVRTLLRTLESYKK